MPAPSHANIIRFHVRYAETDSMGLVHHAAYLVWFEEGRSAFIREHGNSYAALEASGYFLVAADLRAKYLQAARYDQLITVHTWMQAVQSRALTFACEVLAGEAALLCFRATLKLICVDRAGKPTRLPAAWQSWLAELPRAST